MGLLTVIAQRLAMIGGKDNLEMASRKGTFAAR